jgi:hypothetical protein
VEESEATLSEFWFLVKELPDSGCCLDYSQGCFVDGATVSVCYICGHGFGLLESAVDDGLTGIHGKADTV